MSEANTPNLEYAIQAVLAGPAAMLFWLKEHKAEPPDSPDTWQIWQFENHFYLYQRLVECVLRAAIGAK